MLNESLILQIQIAKATCILPPHKVAAGINKTENSHPKPPLNSWFKYLSKMQDYEKKINDRLCEVCSLRKPETQNTFKEQNIKEIAKQVNVALKNRSKKYQSN